MKKLIVVAVNHLIYNLFSYPIELWLFVGICCIAIECLQLPNIGFLFLGLGALSTGILINFFSGLALYQLIIFGLASLFWFLILWLPLKHYVYRKNKPSTYSNMIGNEVYVVSAPIISGTIGQVKWSGTIMNATLEIDEKNPVEVGEKLYIKEMRGNVLICSKNISFNN